MIIVLFWHYVFNKVQCNRKHNSFYTFEMIQNQSVRNRLRNELNVQLTDSNVIQLTPKIIMESRIHQNQDDSVSDMSLIHELGMLDNFQSLEYKNNSNEYIYRNHTVFNENIDNYVYDQRYFYQKISSPVGAKNKINSYRQDVQQQNEYRSVNRVFETRVRGTELRTPPRNFAPIQSRKNISKPTKQQTEIADIESKISILPYQLQQKIKQNLHKKITALSREQHKQPSPIKQKDNFVPEFHRLTSQEQGYMQSSKIPTKSVDQKQTFSNYINRQKFISINREPIAGPKNANVTIVDKQDSMIKQQNLISPHMNLNQNFQRRQKSASREHIIWNSIELKQSPSLIMNNRSISKDREQSVTKNYNNNPKKTADLIQKRKTQFQQFYNNKNNLSTQNNQQNQFNIKQNIFEISEQFNKSKVIKFYTQILSSLPKCKKCSNSYGALTLSNNSVTFACNQCDLKNKQQRSVSFLSSSSVDDRFLGLKWNIEKQCPHYNHPIIGALFDIENKLTNETEMKTYNSLIKDITLEIQKIQETKKKLTKLQSTVEEIKNKIRTNPKYIFEAKNGLKKIFTPQFPSNNSLNFNQQDKLRSIEKLFPPSYLQELDLWCKVKAQTFTQWPLIDEKLQILCPLYMKKNIKTIRQFLDPLLHNFENNDIKISVSEGLKLPVKSLGSATFIVDGSYNISPFNHIERLSMEFLNKRTFREITLMMENLPQKVEQLKVSYNHKLNSHISAQKYPILTKLCSIRSTKKLHATILNCKDQDDLISAMKVMTKKKQLIITTTRSIYVRKPVTDATNQLKEMIKRLGKNIYKCELNLAVTFNQHQMYRELMLDQRNKLIYFSLSSTLVNQTQSEFRKNQNAGDNILVDGFSAISQISHVNSSVIKDSGWLENLPKYCFLKKLRKKLSILALLKDSFKEKQFIQRYKDQKTSQSQVLNHKHSINHTLRLEVLKMLL